MLGICIVFGAALFVSVLLPRNAGLAGLALTSALNLTGQHHMAYACVYQKLAMCSPVGSLSRPNLHCVHHLYCIVSCSSVTCFWWTKS